MTNQTTIIKFFVFGFVLCINCVLPKVNVRWDDSTFTFVLCWSWAPIVYGGERFEPQIVSVGLERPFNGGGGGVVIGTLDLRLYIAGSIPSHDTVRLFLS